jgi:peptidoglycan hydrolase-like protein with peptidoglycan-binding domain
MPRYITSKTGVSLLTYQFIAMKKFLIATGVAVLAVATVAAAQGYAFNTNLTVGSTGPDVSALQTWLIGAGYSIPAISNGTAVKGYFGSQTKAAVEQFQAAHGVPATGFVGPLTRGVLNGGANTAMSTNTFQCPAGYTCVANVPATTATCPAGLVCTPATGTTVTGAPAGITTPGVSGTLTIAQSGSVANGATFNTGQTVNVAGFKLQAGPSDMQVNTITGDFNVRPWLYFSSFSLVNQSTGQVLIPSIPLSAASFTEITPSEDYRITISGLNFVVPHGQTVNVVLTGTALSGISQNTGTYIDLISASVRSVDGTGVVDTENVSSGYVLGTNTTSILGSVLYNGNQTANLIASIDPTSPNAQVIQTQTGSVTNNVPLAVFDIQAQNNTATLQGLTINVGVNGTVNSVAATLSNVFNTIELQAGGNTYYGTMTNVTTVGNVSEGTVVFNSNVSVPLALGTNVPLKIIANVNQGVNGVTASTSLVTPAVTGTSANFVGVDANYNTPTVNANGTIASAITTFSTNAAVTVTAGSIGTPTYTPTTQSNVTGNTGANFPFSFTVAAGTSAVYISATPASAVTVTSSLVPTSTSVTSITAGSTIPGDTNSGLGTNATGSYIVPSNSSRTFTVGVNLSAYGATTTVSNAIVAITGVYYSSSPTASGSVTSTGSESLYTSNLSSLQSPGVSLLNK